MFALRTFRPVNASTLATQTRLVPKIYQRTMASSTAPLQEWLIIVPDHKDALQKRIAARPKHLEGLKADREDMWLWGGMFTSLPCTREDRANAMFS